MAFLDDCFECHDLFFEFDQSFLLAEEHRDDERDLFDGVDHCAGVGCVPLAADNEVVEDQLLFQSEIALESSELS